MNTEDSQSGPLERIVGLQHEYSRLIQLAAQMARRNGMPDVDSWRWPARTPRRLYRDAKFAEQRAEETCAEWAIELRELADRISAYMQANAALSSSRPGK